MGYLDLPRIHVAGRFFADPSTVNNDADHYDPSVKDPSPWQDPYGTHSFEIQDCKVVSALDGQGYPQKGDGIVGMELVSTNLPSSSKMVDLDTFQQAVTGIHGLQLQLTLPDGRRIVGEVQTPALNSVWFSRVLPQRGWNQDYGQGSYGGDANASGVFLTTALFSGAEWPEQSGSAVLDELRAKTLKIQHVDGGEERISVSFRMVLDGYDNVRPPGMSADPSTSKVDKRAHATLWHGRLVGTLGIQRAGEPPYAPGHRWLAPPPFDPNTAAWNAPALTGAPYRVDVANGLLHIDLGNAACMQLPGGNPVAMPNLRATVGGEAIGPVALDGNTYTNFAGIALVEASPERLQQLASAPLVLVDDNGTQWAEDPSGWNLAMVERVARLTSPTGGGTSSLDMLAYLTRWGVPQDGVDVAVHCEPVFGDTQGITMPPGRQGDTEQAVGALTMTVLGPTQDGYATVRVQVLRDPGKRTDWLASQLYFGQVYLAGSTPPDFKKAAPIQEQQLSIVAFADYAVPETVTWPEVQALMEQYMTLYPSMKQRIDLTDEHSFRIYTLNPPWAQQAHMDPTPVDGFDSGAIPYYLTRSFDSTAYMPVSRDLSPNQMATVLAYCRQLQAPYKPKGGQS